MNHLTGMVSLVKLDNIYLAISAEDTLMVGQGSEIKILKKKDKIIGSFDFGGIDLPAYCLDSQLHLSHDSLLLEQSQFCIGLKTSQESDYFVMLCQSFEQVNLSEKNHNSQELPVFMCAEKMLTQGMLEYQNLVYLVTSADRIIDYITGDFDQKQESKNA